MADWYMSPTGDDGTGDGSSGNPYLTLSKCHTEASDGDTVILKDGTHTWLAQVFTKGLTIQAENNGLAIFDANAGATVTWRFDDGTTDINITGIEFTNNYYNLGGAQTRAIFYYEMSVYNAGDLTIDYCKFHEIQIDSQNSGLRNEGLFGRYQGDAAGARTLTMTNCEVWDVWSFRGASYNTTFILNSSNTTTLVLTHNTIYLPGDTAGTDNKYYFPFFMMGGSTEIILKNNIVSSPNAAMDFKLGADAATSTSTNNCYYNMTDLPSGSSDDITSDPLFVDPENGDLNLRPSSPCINTGVLL